MVVGFVKPTSCGQIGTHYSSVGPELMSPRTRGRGPAKKTCWTWSQAIGEEGVLVLSLRPAHSGTGWGSSPVVTTDGADNRDLFQEEAGVGFGLRSVPSNTARRRSTPGLPGAGMVPQSPLPPQGPKGVSRQHLPLGHTCVTSNRETDTEEWAGGKCRLVPATSGLGPPLGGLSRGGTEARGIASPLCVLQVGVGKGEAVFTRGARTRPQPGWERRGLLHLPPAEPSAQAALDDAEAGTVGPQLFARCKPH